MAVGCTVVTGVGPRSLGEAFVKVCLRRSLGLPVIGIDRVPNLSIGSALGYRHVLYDLNPLGQVGGLAVFSAGLRDRIAGATATLGSGGVALLVQSAGAYDYGSFGSYNPDARERVLGLNVLGTTEALHAVMELNGLHSGQEGGLAHVLVGSYHALHCEPLRSIYLSSKAYGLDLCASLVAGGEVSGSAYLALGPVDTPMLHWNHWVRKAGGPEQFFSDVLAGSSEVYEAIFVGCDETVMERVGSSNRQYDLEDLRVAMGRYKTLREGARADDLGILAPDACAEALVKAFVQRTAESGVYVLQSAGGGPGLRLRMASFSSLERERAFETVAKDIPVS